MQQLICFLDPTCSTCATGFTTEPGCDYRGGDLKSIPSVTTLKDCRDQCESLPSCKAFTYNKNDKACYLKSTIGERSCTHADNTAGRRCQLVQECKGW